MPDGAFSHLVSDLEHQLGVRVLERSRRGVSLPHDGSGVAQSVFRSVKLPVRGIAFLPIRSHRPLLMLG
jgi:DNA-binding transcriptional LysR family regulator